MAAGNLLPPVGNKVYIKRAIKLMEEVARYLGLGATPSSRVP